MSEVYNDIMTGLTEAIEDAKAPVKKLKRNEVVIEPIKKYSASAIKGIRLNVGMPQSLFAAYLGVSNKTVEAWEAGTNHPSGVACRILSMMEKDADLTTKFPFVKR